MRRAALVLCVLSILITTASTAVAETLYRITNLGTLGGINSHANDINASGQVTGFSEIPGSIGRGHAFLYDGTTMRNLRTLGGSYSVGYGINASGQVTGFANTAGGSTHAFLYDGTTMRDLRTLGGSYSEGYGINASGQVTGRSYTAGDTGFGHAFLYDGTTMRDLTTLGGSFSYGYGINASGQVTGYSETAAGGIHAFLSDGTTMRELPALHVGRDINASGQVAGWSYTAGGTAHAVLYDGTTTHDLHTVGGSDSYGYGINASGKVTGHISTLGVGGRSSRAFLSRGGVMSDLNSLIDPGLGWELGVATAISDRGQIVGSGRIGGRTRAFRLTMLPENFKQFQNPWGSDFTLNAPTPLLSSQMKESGCFVTSVAMVLTALDHRTDPGQLNELLRPSYPGTGEITFKKFPALTSYGQIDGVEGPPVRFRSAPIRAGSRQDILDQLQSEIDRHGPVILRVPSANRTKGGLFAYPKRVHAVVAYAVEDGQILIRDPGWSHPEDGETLTRSDEFTLDEYVNFVNGRLTNPQYRITGTDYAWLAGKLFTYPDVIDDSTKGIAVGTAHSPIDFVVTDSLGRRLGFDPVQGISYNEIPDSFYARESLVAPTEADFDPDSEHGDLVFEFGDPLPGEYTFAIYGLDDGPWSIDLGVSYATHSSIRPGLMSGIASAGSYQEFSVDGSQFGIVPEPSGTFVLLFAATAFCAFSRLRAIRLPRFG